MKEVKVLIKNGERLQSYNAWNKLMPVAVKGVGQNPDAFQLPPMVRVMLPTDIKLPKGTKVYSNPEFSLKKGLCLVPGIQLILEESEENAVLYVNNVSDSLAIISNDDVIALADIPRKRKTD
jgi:hypothetical protein